MAIQDQHAGAIHGWFARAWPAQTVGTELAGLSARERFERVADLSRPVHVAIHRHAEK